MPKNTALFLILLALLATLLLGINIGKKLATSQYLAQFAPTPTPFIQPTTIPPLKPTVSLTPLAVKSETSTYTDRSCGFTISYIGSYLEQKTENYKSTIITDPDNPDQTIVSTCQQEIPAPPLPPEKIEDIVLDGVPAKLYHDASSKDGTPRDEVIVKHPNLNHEIIIAGYGQAFNDALASFKFIE